MELKLRTTQKMMERCMLGISKIDRKTSKHTRRTSVNTWTEIIIECKHTSYVLWSLLPRKKLHGESNVYTLLESHHTERTIFKTVVVL